MRSPTDTMTLARARKAAPHFGSDLSYEAELRAIDLLQKQMLREFEQRETEGSRIGDVPGVGISARPETSVGYDDQSGDDVAGMPD